METVRPLLVAGNDKLSAGVWHFDVPAKKCCPGRSQLCSRHCYAARNRFEYPQVKERLAWNFEQSKRSDFVDRMVDEMYRKGVILMRWFVSGDLYSPTMARKVLEIMGRSTHTTAWLYTRSWRVEKIFPVIKALSFLPNMHVWLSADKETGRPPEVPEHCRVAWMQTEVEEDTRGADLVFLVPHLRRIELPMVGTVCPTETPEGKARGTSCATCRVCWT